MNTAASRYKSDLRALTLTLTIVVLSGAIFRFTHVQLFAVTAVVAIGLYLIRFGRLAYPDPDMTIEAWQSFTHTCSRAHAGPEYSCVRSQYLVCSGAFC